MCRPVCGQRFLCSAYGAVASVRSFISMNLRCLPAEADADEQLVESFRPARRMLLTITTTHRPANDLGGTVLAANPALRLCVPHLKPVFACSWRQPATG